MGNHNRQSIGKQAREARRAEKRLAAQRRRQAGRRQPPRDGTEDAQRIMKARGLWPGM
jgi:hypothetical protein